MDMKTALERAWQDVLDAKIPNPLQEVAFKEALAHYLGNSPAAQQVNVPVTPVRTSPRAPLSGEKDLFSVLEAETGVDQDQLHELFYLTPDGEPHVNIAARRLGASRAERARSIALLVATSRHFWLNEVEISLDAVREQCMALNCYDGNNFSSDVSSTPGLNYSGPRGKKVLRPKSDVARAFAAKVAEIFGNRAEA